MNMAAQSVRRKRWLECNDVHAAVLGVAIPYDRSFKGFAGLVAISEAMVMKNTAFPEVYDAAVIPGPPDQAAALPIPSPAAESYLLWRRNTELVPKITGNNSEPWANAKCGNHMNRVALAQKTTVHIKANMAMI